MLTDIELLALATRSPTAQQVIVNSRRINLLTTLARSPHLDPFVADRLAVRSEVAISQPALYQCRDLDVLARGARRGVLRARWALRNKNMPVDVLTSDLHSDNDEAVLARAINPTTPVEHRQKLLSREVIEANVANRTPMSYGVVRGYEIALANPWLVNTPDRWTQNLRRGLTGLVDLTPDQHAALTTGRTPWPAKRLHPAVTGIELDSTPIVELVFAANPAIDLYLLGREDLTVDVASRMVVKRGDYATEPHIIGRLVERFGVGVLADITEPDAGYTSSTRLSASVFTHPAAVFGHHIEHHVWSHAEQASAILGDNPDAWEVAIGLADTWHLGVMALVEAAIKLTGGA